MTDTERFLAKVNKTNDCWLWTAGTTKEGYGQFKFEKSSWLAHRFSYVLFVGQLQDDDVVRHTCDTPGCVNPEHLLVGTHADNVRDKVERGRSCVGKLNGRSKLTAGIVKQCRQSKETSKTLAKKYGVSGSTMVRARKGLTWK